VTKTLTILMQAIRDQHLISFVYDEDTSGRLVEPYAIFPRGDDLIIDGRHIAGYHESDRAQWKYRQFKLSKISAIRLGRKFRSSNAKYNPTAKLYNNALIKR